MLCSDRTEVTWDETLAIAAYFASEQRRQITAAIRQVLSHQAGAVSHILVSGSGSFLAEALCEELSELRCIKQIPLRNLFAASISEAACAFAIARLAQERADSTRTPLLH